MSSNSASGSFPETESEALAYLYIQQQDLSHKTPAEIANLYREAYEEITDALRKHRGIPPRFSND